MSFNRHCEWALYHAHIPKSDDSPRIGCTAIVLVSVVLTSAFSGGVLADIGLIPKSERVDLYFTYDDVHSLTIDSGAGTLRIKPGHAFSATASQTIRNPGSVGAFDINCGVGEVIVNLTP